MEPTIALAGRRLVVSRPREEARRLGRRVLRSRPPDLATVFRRAVSA